jgi:hypothetical protein
MGCEPRQQDSRTGVLRWALKHLSNEQRRSPRRSHPNSARDWDRDPGYRCYWRLSADRFPNGLYDFQDLRLVLGKFESKKQRVRWESVELHSDGCGAV